MEIITLESETFKKIESLFNEIHSKLSLIMTANPAYDEILTQEKACIVLDVTPKTLALYRFKYGLKGKKLGNKFYYQKSELVKFLFAFDPTKKKTASKSNYFKY